MDPIYLGINFAFAKLLIENGCNVLIADLALRPEAKVLVDQHSDGSPRAFFQETDVRDWLQLERMFEVAEQEFGEIDIICPGAGVYEPVCMGAASCHIAVYNTHTKKADKPCQ